MIMLLCRYVASVNQAYVIMIMSLCRKCEPGFISRQRHRLTEPNDYVEEANKVKLMVE